MHGATLIAPNGKPLRPSILWNDGRSGLECQELENAVPRLSSTTGNRAMPGFTAPKLLWVKKHEPKIFSQIAKVLLPKDYVRLCMTGDYASDMSDSAGTLWMDTKARKWSDDILSATNLSQDHMPKLYEGPQVTGQLRAELANTWDMDRVPVVAGGGDNAAGAVGSGVVQKEDGFVSLGTSGVIFMADDTYRPNPADGVHTFCHAVPNRWHQMSVILSAASAIDWVSGICGFKTPSDLYAAAAEAGRISDQEVFLPYLSGERTPHNNPSAQGVFFGMTHQTDKVRLGQAALEGVAFALADGVEALKNAGVSIKTLSVIGGGSQSSYWGQILASAFNIPLVYRDNSAVGPAFGAAQLARLGTTSESIENICIPPKILNTIEPDTQLRDQLSSQMERFRSLYPVLTEKFEENQS